MSGRPGKGDELASTASTNQTQNHHLSLVIHPESIHKCYNNPVGTTGVTVINPKDSQTIHSFSSSAMLASIGRLPSGSSTFMQIVSEHKGGTHV